MRGVWVRAEVGDPGKSPTRDTGEVSNQQRCLFFFNLLSFFSVWGRERNHVALTLWSISGAGVEKKLPVLANYCPREGQFLSILFLRFASRAHPSIHPSSSFFNVTIVPFIHTITYIHASEPSSAELHKPAPSH